MESLCLKLAKKRMAQLKQHFFVYFIIRIITQSINEIKITNLIIILCIPCEQCENSAGRNDPFHGRPTEMIVDVGEWCIGVLYHENISIIT